MKSSSATRLILFLLFAIIAFVAVVVSAEEDAAPAKSKCPLAGKCPNTPVLLGEETGGCPLKKGAWAELFTAKGHKCPLAGKCPFYDDIKAGKEINFDGKKCPIADKCP
ncbi:hypothetical protein BC829DRAFT_407568 [Chytridium lagenaria]|nr:hypothetical protein BC829DRAFT_407568 [Chytridium lagenaria]